MSRIIKRAYVDRSCVACGNCVKKCPVRAISIHKGMYATASDRCIGCGKCVAACPAGAIEVRAVKAVAV